MLGSVRVNWRNDTTNVDGIYLHDGESYANAVQGSYMARRSLESIERTS